MRSSLLISASQHTTGPLIPVRPAITRRGERPARRCCHLHNARLPDIVSPGPARRVRFPYCQWSPMRRNRSSVTSRISQALIHEAGELVFGDGIERDPRLAHRSACKYAAAVEFGFGRTHGDIDRLHGPEHEFEFGAECCDRAGPIAGFPLALDVGKEASEG